MELEQDDIEFLRKLAKTNAAAVAILKKNNVPVEDGVSVSRQKKAWERKEQSKEVCVDGDAIKEVKKEVDKERKKEKGDTLPETLGSAVIKIGKSTQPVLAAPIQNEQKEVRAETIKQGKARKPKTSKKERPRQKPKPAEKPRDDKKITLARKKENKYEPPSVEKELVEKTRKAREKFSKKGKGVDEVLEEMKGGKRS